MKKLLISAILLVGILHQTTAQFIFGLKATPYLSSTRINISDDIGTDLQRADSKIRFQFGPTLDWEFKDNHFVSTGVFFSNRAISFQYSDSSSNQLIERHQLSFIQIPISLKLFTEEVGLDKKIYFQFGGLVDFKTSDEQTTDLSNPAISKFNFSGLNGMLSVGLEYGFGINTKVFAGLTYQRGVFNLINEYSGSLETFDWSAQHDLFGLEAGITF